ncbi:MAG: sialidase family protein [Ginsengibacter sp.]
MVSINAIKCFLCGIFFLLTNGTVTTLSAQVYESGRTTPKIVSRSISAETPHFYKSIYVTAKSFQLRSGDFVSIDNGKTWSKKLIKPDFSVGLPNGYRRDPVSSVLDNKTGRIVTIFNALDVEDLDSTIDEPSIAQKTYYLRYRVSKDSGKTWQFDNPIIQAGEFTFQHPFPEIFIGKNSIYLGDIGSIPVISKKGKILVPAQTTPLGPDGKLWNPGGGFTYTDVVVLIGTWTNDDKITWKMSNRIKGDPHRSTRGMIEPTLSEMKDGSLLMVMRGSNEGKGISKDLLPSYKWYSVSNDGGETWSNPQPFTFEDGKAFYSPSSMSTLFKHSSGRCFWVGNMNEENSKGNLPRWPLVFAEVNTKNLNLIRKSLLIADTHEEEDNSHGRLDISHISLIEDRKTKEIILTYPRSYNAYQSREWVTTRIAVE